MDAVVDVDGVAAERVQVAAAAQGIETMPPSAYYFGAGRGPNALLPGFGAISPAGVTKLVRTIEAIRN